MHEEQNSIRAKQEISILWEQCNFMRPSGTASNTFEIMTSPEGEQVKCIKRGAPLQKDVANGISQDAEKGCEHHKRRRHGTETMCALNGTRSYAQQCIADTCWPESALLSHRWYKPRAPEGPLDLTLSLPIVSCVFRSNTITVYCMKHRRNVTHHPQKRMKLLKQSYDQNFKTVIKIIMLKTNLVLSINEWINKRGNTFIQETNAEEQTHNQQQ